MNKKLILTLMAVVLASAAMAQGNGIKAVSYTHLTLPTTVPV